MKSFVKRFFTELIVGAILFIVVVITYRYLVFSFFQQDEWYSLGHAMVGGIFTELTTFPPLYYLAGYIRFFGTLFNNTLHYYFPLNAVPFAVVGILFHWLNSLLVYFLAATLSHKKTIGFFSAIFFAVSTIHHQALSWFASTTTTLPSLTFALLSVLSTIYAIKNHTRSVFYLSQLLMIISYIFKESTVYLFLLLPLLFFYARGVSRRSVLSAIQLYMPTICYFVFVVFLRLYILTTDVGKVGAYITTEKNSFGHFLTQMILYPLIGFSQTFIPPDLLYTFSTHVAKWPLFQLLFHIPNPVDYFGFIKTTDYVSILLSFMALSLSFIFLYKNPPFRKVMSVSIFILFISFIPLAVLIRENTSYFESRYYYIASVGAAMIFATVIMGFISLLFQRISIRAILVTIVILVVSSGYFYKHVSLTRAELLQQNIESAERKMIIANIHQFFPKLDSRSVFLVEGDSLGYYGITNQKLPFQQGMGYTLMVLFYKTGMIPSELLRDGYLWDIRDEGYTEIGGNGFGFYSSYDRVDMLLQENPSLSPNNVYAVFWDSSKGVLTNRTEQIRLQLTQNTIK